MSRKDERKENYYFKKQRVGLVLVGGFMSLFMGLSMTPAIAGLIAQIQNSVNTARTASLVMKETGPGASGEESCESKLGAGNSHTCGTINKYGGTNEPLIPGKPAKETTIKISNTGDIPANTFTVKGEACSASAFAGASHSGTGTNTLCEKVKVVLKSGATTIFEGTAKQFQDAQTINLLEKLGKQTINPNEEIPLTFAVSLDNSADATHQGLQISQPITWQFGA